jgi:predicted permease
VFGEAEAHAAVVVLEHDYWRDRLGADPGVIGSTIQVTGKPYTVIGVAPEGFRGLQKDSRPVLWVPIGRAADVRAGFAEWRSPNWIWLSVFARVPGGSDWAAAESAANVALQRHGENRIAGMGSPNPERETQIRASRARLQPAAYGDPSVRDRAARTLKLLGAVTGLILLLACANVANLMLGRASTRRQEIAMQLTLGAGRFRVVRQLLVESLILAASGGAAGAFLAWTAAPWIGAQLDLEQALPLSWPVLGFTAAVSLASGVAFGVAPAVAASDISLAQWLKGGGLGAPERSWGTRGLLVVAQAALCIPVLVAAGLLLQTLRNLHAVSTGMAVEQIAQGSVNPQANGYDRERSVRVLDELERRLAARPEVRSAALGNSTAFTGWTSGRNLYRGDSDEEVYPDGVSYGSVSASFFDTLGIPLLAGRGFEPGDTAEAPKVVVVNHTLARIYFGQENPVGRQVRYSKDGPADMTIVGLAGDSAHDDLRSETKPFLYRPISQSPAEAATIYVRAAGSPDAIVRLLPAELAAVDPNLPMTAVRTLAESVERSLRRERRLAALLSAFGLLGLTIAAVGLYGVLSYAVARRTREMGLRKALGAQAAEIVAMIVRRGLAWVAAGALLGAGLAWAAGGLIEATLFGLAPADGRVYVGAGALLLAVASLAALLPARRAAAVEPAEALRHQ